MKKIIAANWKNNGSKEFIKNYFDYFTKNLSNTNKNEIIFFPPDLYMDQINKYRKKSNFNLGGQDLVVGSNSTLTGGNSSDMFIDNGCSHILIGHSEIRQQKLSDYHVDCRLHFNRALEVIFCVGENDDERKNNNTVEKLSEQLKGLIEQDKKPAPPQVIVAYEPVWAIGSGKIPELDDISFIHRFIKNNILEKLPSLKEKDIMVLYGGSVNLKNAKDILSAPHVDGVLIGGASLKVKEFTSICNLKI